RIHAVAGCGYNSSCRPSAAQITGLVSTALAYVCGECREGSAMILARKGFLWGIGVLGLIQAAAWAQTSPLVGDGFIQPGSGTNFGGTPTVNVGGVNGFQGLLQFDLTILPPGTTAASVSSAYLKLYVNKIGTAGAITVNVATNPWSEGTVTGLSGVGVGAFVAGPISVNVANA